MKKIKSIEVKGSSFYEDFKLEFSDKLNCIMGGRGTGKTTLLYFLKSSLERNIEESSIALRVLKSNLGEGTITVELEKADGVAYAITKTIFENPQPYQIPTMEYVSIERIFDDIECDFYEAGKIERIGMNSLDRLDLIDKMIKNDIQVDKEAIKITQMNLEANADDIIFYNKRLSQLDDIIVQYDTVEEEFEILKKQQPTGISEVDKLIFEKADTSEKTRKIERRFFNKTIDILFELRSKLESIDIDLTEFYLSEVDNPDTYDNKDLMNRGFNLLKEHLSKAKSSIKDLIGNNVDTQSKLSEIFRVLVDDHELQQAQFVQLKQKFDINKEYINKYNTLSKNVTEKMVLNRDRDDLLAKRNKLKVQRATLLRTFDVLRQSVFRKRLQAVINLNNSFNGDIVISLDFGGFKTEFAEALRNSLRGSGLQYNMLVPKIVKNFSPDKFASVIDRNDYQALKNIAGIDEIRSKSIIDSLKETAEVYKIETLYCHDLPEFKLKIADDAINIEDNYRRTDELSMGQRCTTVLPIIFAVSDNPLVIDQPEDNLDNKYITQRIHEIIRKQKEKRQLIFITHNPNIPVLSDSDFNVFFGYEDRLSKIEKTGDVVEVTDEIVSLLEGGATAFEKRMEIYGYDKN